MKILEQLKNNLDVLNIYMYGSRVYGVATEISDYDFVMIVKDEVYTTDKYSDGNCDFNIYSKSQWIEMAKENNLTFCECYFLPNEFKIKEEFIPEFNINTTKLRASFSSIASNSWVKCKKKLIIEKDFAPYIGKKSIWHSFRILMFGIQILSKGRIYDYTEANFLYDEIINNENNDWNFYKFKYQEKYNHYKSEFRKFDHIEA